MTRGSSPISSRKTVPPSAASKSPTRVLTAPEKAPRSWPKSSLSTRFSGMAAQLMAR